MSEHRSSVPEEIPDKLYFKIGEVSAIAGVPTHVLRFWETEFPKVNPRRTATGQRMYTRKDVELILEIKNLLYERKFTIQGARQYLRAGEGRSEAEVRQLIEDLRTELERIRDALG
jgi:DNA-binding transcriptional MerR regulator